MKLPLWRRLFSGSVGIGAGIALLAALFLARAIVVGQPPKPPPIRDRPKADIEMPTKRILAKQTDAAAVKTADTFVNPKVLPGKVRWHKDFDAACQAAKKSGKPVLLFQMMGRLDERFC
jgi:hypothetical protein